MTAAGLLSPRVCRLINPHWRPRGHLEQESPLLISSKVNSGGLQGLCHTHLSVGLNIHIEEVHLARLAFTGGAPRAALVL